MALYLRAPWVGRVASPMSKRILIYVLPFLLLFLEWMLRTAFAVDAHTFAGPTVAAAGLGLLLPVIIPKPINFGLPLKVQKLLTDKNCEILTKSARLLTDIAFVAVFLCIGLWAYSLFLSWKSPEQIWWRLPCYMYPACINYGLAIILTEIKEAL